LKVLIVNQHFEDGFGGSEIQCDIVASQLTKFGHDVVYGIINAQKHSYDVEYDWIPIKKPFAVCFQRVLSSLKPDIVYWRFDKYHLLVATLLARCYRATFVFHVSSFSDTERWLPSGVRVYNPKTDQKREFVSLTRLTLSKYRRFPGTVFNYYGFYLVDAVICEKDDDMGKLPVKTQVKIYDSVISNYKPFNWNKPFVIWVASLKRIKNPEKYIELAEHFRERNIDFLMIGTIQDPRYKYVMDKTQVPSNLHYLGVVETDEEVYGIIRSSLFLVHTCDPEGFSCIFQQAWVQGKPTVSLYFDPESIIEKQRLGYCSKTWPKFVEHVRELICNEQIRSEMGQRAREFAIQHFDAETNVRRLESLFASILTQ